MERLPRFGQQLRWQRQPSMAEQNVLQATGELLNIYYFERVIPGTQ